MSNMMIPYSLTVTGGHFTAIGYFNFEYFKHIFMIALKYLTLPNKVLQY